MTRLLIVEDDEKIRASLLLQLREEGYAPQALGSAEEALAHLEEPRTALPDLILLDVRMRGMSGVDLVRRLAGTAGARRFPPTIIISGEASISETVEALRLGVHDFIEKPFSRERLLQSIRNALEHHALKREVATLKAGLRGEPAILGDSPAIEALRQRIARAAATDARVLIVGESGTGKELVASALHGQSARGQKPFIKINCAAIPHHLVEDELFGHAKGAFTDAKMAKPGLFEEADGGTLFLDEIGDMDLTMQSRLLRVLEDGRVRRVGETRDRQVDVRVLAATHRHLEEEVKAGRFREDLYFRLAHLPLPVPSLRERREDIPLLFRHFLEHFSRQHRTRPRRADPELMPYLERYAWPGNVRELRNLCERLVVFGADPLTPEDLPSAFFESASAPAPETGLLLSPATLPIVPLRDFKAQCEREYIESVLRRTRWNFTAAARVLDVQRTYLHQKVKVLGIRRPGAEGEEEVANEALG
ncbi:MAG TPA: sigma-54 dependent transcriptional regulator [Thermoanaerobaculia bacterium]|jgi:DNA-binding NtrC family response regulator|nr:sigma-54 dependent transcriptional regulator [Thermoanaerobaculia bacterium]